MTACRYCSGQGRAPASEPRKPREVRGASSGKLPPFGREVEAAEVASTLPDEGIWLFCGTCPTTGKDPWEQAAWARAKRGEGSAMVLPPGEAATDYRWPALTSTLVAWAYGFDQEGELALGRSLIEAGYDLVEVCGGPSGPLRFTPA